MVYLLPRSVPWEKWCLRTRSQREKAVETFKSQAAYIYGHTLRDPISRSPHRSIAALLYGSLCNRNDILVRAFAIESAFSNLSGLFYRTSMAGGKPHLASKRKPTAGKAGLYDATKQLPQESFQPQTEAPQTKRCVQHVTTCAESLFVRSSAKGRSAVADPG